MIKHCIAAAIVAGSLSANEIQVFSSQTNGIAVDGQSSFEKLYYGPAADYYEDPAKYLNPTTLAQASFRGLASRQGAIKEGAKGSALPVAAMSPGKTAFEWSGTDHNYLYVSMVTNRKGEQSIAYTLIVSGDVISDPDGEALALADQKKL